MSRAFGHLPEISGREVTSALDTACGQVLRNLPPFTYRSQNHSSVGGFYPPCENDQWTTGFWPGQIWLAFEHTGNPLFQYAGLIQVESFLGRIENKVEVDHHDMGFLYSPSCVAAWKLTGSERAKRAAILAADQLIARFQPVGAFLQAWGTMGAPENYRYIIDCLLNLPLLYWASQVTGNGVYAEIARRHTDTCLAHSFRPDHSTYHTFYMDPATGEPSHGATCQGYRDDSAWTRGQAWAVYGLALSTRYTGRSRCRELFEPVLNYYLTRLPPDMIPYWDLTFTAGETEPRDSSSASIVACGLLEMARHVEADTGRRYAALARKMMRALVDGYRVKDPAKSNGQVLHGTYSKKSPYNTCTPEGVDECVSWGDYFYMEALTRLHRDWELYW